MTTLLKKDYQYSSVLWEEVMQRVQEIIRDEYNISPYVSPTLNPKTPSPFRIWSSAQGTDALYVGAWHKEYTISVNHYLKTEDSERFYRKVYEESERLYQLFFNNQGTQSTQTLGFFGGRPEGIQISQEGDYFRIEVLFTCEVLRADDVVYVQTLPSEIRATRRALELPFNFWSLDFDGTDDSVNCGSVSSLDDIFDGGGSVSVWFNASAINTTHTIVSKKSGGTGWWAIRISDHGGNKGRFYFAKTFDGGSSYTTQQSTRDINPNTWYHAVVVYNADSASNRITAYINGEEVTNLIADGSEMAGTSAPTGTRISDASQNFLIGKDNQFEFLGQISELSVFNTELTSSTVSTIYNNGQPILLTENQGGYKSSGNLVSYYRMGSGSGDDRSTDGLIADQVDSSIGSELLDETSDFTDAAWDDDGTITFSDGNIVFARTDDGDGSYTTGYLTEANPFTVEPNATYKVELTISSYTAGKLIINSNITYGSNGTIESAGTHIGYIRPPDTHEIRLKPDGLQGFVGILSAFSVKKVSGNAGIMQNFDSLDFRTNVPLLYDKALFSNSLLFDGTDDQINCGSGSSIDNIFDGGGSVSLWFNPSAQSSTLGIIKKQYVGGWYFDLADHSGGTSWRGKFVQTFDGDNYQIQGSSRTFSIGNWYNVVIVYNSSATSNTATIYVNGEVLSITTDSTPSGTRHDDSSGNLLIGDTGSYEFFGNIADVALFNSTLDATNVTAIYNSGKPIDLTCDAGNYNNANNLVGYWKMGDGYLDELPSATHGGAIYDQVTPVEGSDISIYDGEDVNVSAYANIESDTLTSVQSGCVYKFNYTITNYVSGSFRIRQSLGASSLDVTGGTGNGNGDYEFYLLTTNTNNFVIDAYNLGFVGTISNYEVRKVEGNVGLAQNMNASAQSISVPE